MSTISSSPVDLAGGLDASGMTIGVVAARWNDHVVAPLLDGALQTLAELGASSDHVRVLRVPGAFELPVVAAEWTRGNQVDAVICIGAVIRGDTPHFEYVAGPVSSELARLSTETGVPVIFGVLTCDTDAQAMDRAGGKDGNKGSDAAKAAVEMVSVLRTLRGHISQ